jgi:5-methylcytosine-specific restriction endonuclease McrA
MTKLVDITNLRFGKLTVLEITSLRAKNGQIFWKCLCDCGIETKALANSLRRGNTASCGCYRLLANIKYSPQISTARRAFKNYRFNDRGIPISISFDDFYKLSQLNCYYCSAVPSNCTKSENNSPFFKENGEFIYNGLDRIDSSKGYDIDNVITCCKYCNKSKCAMTLSEFKLHLQNMLNIRKSLYDGDYCNIKPINASIIIPLNRNPDFSKPFIDEIVNGITIGKWKILCYAGKDSGGKKKYLCECTCGVRKEVDANNLKSGKSRACSNSSCYQEYPSDIYKARAIWISRYKDDDLSFEDFYAQSQMSCAYCGVKPSQIVYAKNNKQFIYNGLDRIDILLSHNKNNIVPCCYDCNKIKNDRSLSQLDNWLTNINKNWISKLTS